MKDYRWSDTDSYIFWMETRVSDCFSGWSQTLASWSSAIFCQQAPRTKVFPHSASCERPLSTFLASLVVFRKTGQRLTTLVKHVPFIPAENQLALSSANASENPELSKRIWKLTLASSSWLLSVGRGMQGSSRGLSQLKDMLAKACNQKHRKNSTTEVRKCCELPTSTQEPIVKQLLVDQLSVTILSPDQGGEVCSLSNK